MPPLTADSAPPPPPDAPSPAFLDLAHTSAQLSRTRSRLEKKRILVSLLATVPGSEIAAAVGWLVGEPLAAPLGIGPAQLGELGSIAHPAAASLTLSDVESQLARAKAKQGSHADKLSAIAALYAKLVPSERAFLAGALTGSLRQGSLGGVMLLAVAERAGRSEADVRRMVMIRGSISAAAAELASAEASPEPGAPPLAAIELFDPVAPMLASTAASAAEALIGLAGQARVEWKIDGVRAQVHLDRTEERRRIAIYSRQGNDITAGCAPLLPELQALAASTLVLDGEVVLVGPDGTARPFQDSFSAIAGKGLACPGDRLRIFLFDCLHRDGADLLDAPLAARLDALRAVAPPELVVPGARITTAEDANRFYADALAKGNEGVVVKDLEAPYRFGARGRAWQKVKEVTTVDLVVLAAEWGSGRRKGYLSNLHLGARDRDGLFCMVGKTFKGLTDEMLRWQTDRLQAIAAPLPGALPPWEVGKGGRGAARAEHVVRVRPELVVEVRFNDVQRSPRYPGGVALRFARVVRYREDKSAADVEPLASLVARIPSRGDAGNVAASANEERAPRAAKKKRQLSLFDD